MKDFLISDRKPMVQNANNTFPHITPTNFDHTSGRSILNHTLASGQSIVAPITIPVFAEAVVYLPFSISFTSWIRYALFF